MEQIKIVIFDLDGTLVDAYAAIRDSFNQVMRSLGYPVQPLRIVREAVGRGDANLLRSFIGDRYLERALLLYRKHHAVSLLERSRLLPGAITLLSYLREKGVLLAVASNRPTRFSRILIRHLGLDKYFDYVLCADKLKQGKPDPEIILRILSKFSLSRRDAVYVGDMAIDAEAGMRSGVKTVIVLTGSSSRKQVKPLRPWKIVSNLRQLRKILSR